MNHARSGRPKSALRFAGMAAPPAAILLLALFLRTYRLEVVAWLIDSYEQLESTQRLIHGHIPFSPIYPPGIALTMAPAFLILPATLATMQAVIIAASLVLVVVCYCGVLRGTAGRTAATLLAAGVATAPPFVDNSRIGLFDVINTMWIAMALLLLPFVRRRTLVAAGVYGVLLAVAVNVRATDAAFLPAVLILWAGIGRPGVGLRDAARAAWCTETAVTTGVLVTLFGVLAYTGGWLEHATGAPVTFDAFAGHVGMYLVAELGGDAAPVLAPLAFLGAIDVGRRDRAFLYALLYILVVWPVVHAPVPFANERYMLPALLVTLLLAAHAPAGVAHVTEAARVEVRRAGRAAVAAAIAMLALIFLGADIAHLRDWPAPVGRSDEAAMRELRPAVAALPAGSLLVSPATRGVRHSNARLEYFDLVDYSIPRGNGAGTVEAVLDRIATSLAARRRVYYLHSRIEASGLTFASGGPGYEAYFEGIERRFGATLVFSSSSPDNALYEVGR